LERTADMMRTTKMAERSRNADVRPWNTLLALLAAVLLAAVLLGGCLAEEGLPEENDTGPVVENPVWADVDPLLQTCRDNCHSSEGTMSCDMCHAGEGRTAAQLNPLDYANMVDITNTTLTTTDLVVDSGSSDTSVLWWVLSGDSRYLDNGGAMRSYKNSLGSSENETIQNWIDTGANQ